MSWTGTYPYELESGQVIGVHSSPADCFNGTCAIHAGKPHSLSLAPRFWDPDTDAIFRICAHGGTHPDLDTRPGALCWCACDCCAY